MTAPAIVFLPGPLTGMKSIFHHALDVRTPVTLEPAMEIVEAERALWTAEIGRLNSLLANSVHRIDIDAVLDNASGHLDSCRRYVNGKGECDCILADLARLIGQKPIGAKP